MSKSVFWWKIRKIFQWCRLLKILPRVLKVTRYLRLIRQCLNKQSRPRSDTVSARLIRVSTVCHWSEFHWVLSRYLIHSSPNFRLHLSSTLLLCFIFLTNYRLESLCEKCQTAWILTRRLIMSCLQEPTIIDFGSRVNSLPFLGYKCNLIKSILTHLCRMDSKTLTLCTGPFTVVGCLIGIPVLNATSVDPDQTPLFLASDLIWVSTVWCCTNWFV